MDVKANGAALKTRPIPRLQPKQFGMLEPVAITAIVISGLFLGRTIFVPLAIGVILSFVLYPVVLKLRSLGLSKALAVGVMTFAAFAALTGLAVLMGRQVVSFAEDLPRYQDSLVQKIKTIKNIGGSDNTISRAAQTIKVVRNQIDSNPSPEAASSGDLSGRAQNTTTPIVVSVQQSSSALDQLFRTIAIAAEPVASIGFILVFVVVLLLYREDLRDRAIRLFGVHDLEMTTRAMDDAGQRLNRYFLTSALINAGFGLVIACGLWWIGIPNPALWGVLAMLLRYIPFAGVPIAAIIPVLLSLVVDPGWTMVVATLGLFIAAELIVSQAVETKVQGDATGLSPLALILAATFWALLWGPAGLFLAVPLTVILAVAGRHVDGFGFLDIALGNQPALSPIDRFYQRILSGDAEDAAGQAQAAHDDTPIVAFYDDVVMPTIGRAFQDGQTGRLDSQRRAEVRQTLEAFIALMDDVVSEEASGQALQTATDEVQWPSVICVGLKPGLSEIVALALVQVFTEHAIPARFANVRALPAHHLVKAAIICVCGIATDHEAPLKFLQRRLQRLQPDAHLIAVLIGGEDAVKGEGRDVFHDTAQTLAMARDRVASVNVSPSAVLPSIQSVAGPS